MERSSYSQPISVSAFLSTVKNLLDESFENDIQVKGEISSFRVYDSGHWYFSIKDNDAQIGCVMFKHSNQYVTHSPKEGDMVVITGRPDIYKQRGQFQFIAIKLKSAGQGDIRLEFERIKKKLREEGLFDEKKKKPIPRFIRNLCVITSSQGAAMHDVRSVLERRMPAMRIYLAPSLVQGERAAQNLIEMLELANNKGGFDAILITRGGGSPEDLHCFNDENLARAIYVSKLPVISAVGHEVDYTICDFVADYRSPTPSAAAEELSLDTNKILTGLEDDKGRMRNFLLHRISNHFQDTDEQWQRIKRIDLIESKKRQLFGLKQQGLSLISYYLVGLERQLEQYSFTVRRNSPQAKHKEKQNELRIQSMTLNYNMRQFIEVKQQEARLSFQMLSRIINLLKEGLQTHRYELQQDSSKLTNLMAKRLGDIESKLQNHIIHLKAINPRNVLRRGYSLVKDSQGKLVTDVANLAKGDFLEMELAKGKLSAEVKEIDKT